MALDKWLQDKRQVSLIEAKEVADRGGQVIYRPDPSLPEHEQFAVVLNEPED